MNSVKNVTKPRQETSEARIQANRLNAEKSTGPRTDAGKAASRENALKHGMAGEGTVLPPDVRTQFSQRLDRWNADFRPESDAEVQLIRKAVLASVRLDRCADAEFVDTEDCNAAILDNIPEDSDPRTLNAAITRALIDISPHANLRRRYETASDHELHRALRSLINVQKHRAKLGRGPIPVGSENPTTLNSGPYGRKPSEGLGLSVPRRPVASVEGRLPTPARRVSEGSSQSVSHEPQSSIGHSLPTNDHECTNLPPTPEVSPSPSMNPTATECPRNPHNAFQASLSGNPTTVSSPGSVSTTLSELDAILARPRDRTAQPSRPSMAQTINRLNGFDPSLEFDRLRKQEPGRPKPTFPPSRNEPIVPISLSTMMPKASAPTPSNPPARADCKT